jgi:hypothetical protein
MKLNNFISLNEWILNESKQKEDTFGCVMMEGKIDNWEDNHLEGISPKDIYEVEGDDSYGLEEIPHITILYGIHEDEIDPDSIVSVIESKMKPINIEIDEIDFFENDENDEYDVVKYNVLITKELLRYREIFEKSFLNTQTFPEYKPHITIAYVKKGTGKKYKKKLDNSFKVRFNKGIYSWHDDNGERKRRSVNLEPEKEEKTKSGIV